MLPAAAVRAGGGDDAARLAAFVWTAGAFNRLFTQEKVYLNFDNTGYFKGETIWYKAYVARADSLGAAPPSRVLYVELLNPMGDVVETQKLPIRDGQAHGDFHLDKPMATGFYEVRAYTRYMMNWDGAWAFSRVLPVFARPRRLSSTFSLAVTDADTRTDVDGASDGILRINMYLHHQFPWKQKGVRRAHFQGYNVPRAFYDNDYGVMPREDDFRRTLFWAPDVTAGADGRAEASFWNNSTCRSIHVSAEGTAPDGMLLTYRPL